MAKATGEQEAVDSKRVGYFASLNYGKKSITFNMNNPKAVEIVKEMVKVSDIVAENFGKAVMEHWGLGYNDLKQDKTRYNLLRGDPAGEEPALIASVRLTLLLSMLLPASPMQIVFPVANLWV